MFRSPLSKKDVTNNVHKSNKHVARPSLNQRLSEASLQPTIKFLLVSIVTVFLLFVPFLIACGNGSASHTSAASSTSQTTSPSNTPILITTSTSLVGPTTTSTTEPTNNPTGGPTTTPPMRPTITPTIMSPPDPSSFTVTEAGITYAFIGSAGQQAEIDPNKSDFPDPYIDVTYGNHSSPNPAGPIDWSVLANKNWIGLNPGSGSLKFGSSLRVNINVSIPQETQVGTYSGKFVFSPDTSGNNYANVILTVVPYVSMIGPTYGPAAGGTSVIISGYGFTGATSASFGSVAASNFTVNSDTQITASSPAGTGTVHVTVTDAFGTSLPNNGDQFTYNSPPPVPVVSSISPTNGPAAGGISVIIIGSGFTGATAVSFGSTAASSFTFNSDTQITAVSPAGSGTVDITVTTPIGTSTLSTADQFTYT